MAVQILRGQSTGQNAIIALTIAVLTVILGIIFVQMGFDTLLPGRYQINSVDLPGGTFSETIGPGSDLK